MLLFLSPISRYMGHFPITIEYRIIVNGVIFLSLVSHYMSHFRLAIV
jgi:hypothetical protein